MSDSDWKAKYFASIRAIEEDERRARDLEDVLRRVVARLCVVARGQDTQLDSHLTNLAEANRKNAGAEDLTKLVSHLRDSVAVVDHKTALVKALVERTGNLPILNPDTVNLGAAQRWTASCDAVALVLKQLAREDTARDLADTLTAELRTAETDQALADILTKIANSLQRRADDLASERQQAKSLLTEMTARLDEVTDFLSYQSDERQTALGDADNLNSDVLHQVDSITEAVRTTNDLMQIKSVIGDRLAIIATKAREYRAREESRFLEQSAVAQKMASRVAELERQTSELHRSLHKEQKRSRLDPLTGIPNRSTFDERLADEINRFKRFRDPVAVLIWDLDHFKTINDTYGHRAGDKVLQQVAKTFGSRLRATDVLARFGGEEFVMLLVGTDADIARVVAEKLRKSVEEQRFHFHDKPVVVTASCGITQLREADTAEAVFDRADAALYRAKKGGRNLCIAA